jgi:two-component system, NtrC family, sensor kinase
MLKAEYPDNEADRLDTLHHYEIMDTSPEEAFDHITGLATRICETPMAMINLIDSNRQWFKSKVGFDISEMTRDVGLCPHAILKPGPFIINDTTQDARFADDPVVTSEPHIRFFAAAPLITPGGHAIGTLCVMDREPRNLGREQTEALRFLARQVVSLLELRRKS